MILKRIAILAAFVPVFLFAADWASAEKTDTLGSLNSSYDWERIQISQAYIEREKEALEQYEKALNALLPALQQRGDLDNYLLVEQEKKRLAAEGTLPDATKSVPVLASAVEPCRKAVADAKEILNRRTVELLKKHIAALDRLIKQQVQADKIEEAKAIKADRDKAAAELAGLETKAPPAPEKADAIKTYSSCLWMTARGRWADANIPPVKKGAKLVFRCEQRPLKEPKGKYARDVFKLRIGESSSEFRFDSNGKYSRPSTDWYGTVSYTPEPSLTVTAENDGRLFVYRNGAADFKLVVTVE